MLVLRDKIGMLAMRRPSVRQAWHPSLSAVRKPDNRPVQFFVLFCRQLYTLGFNMTMLNNFQNRVPEHQGSTYLGYVHHFLLVSSKLRVARTHQEI